MRRASAVIVGVLLAVKANAAFVDGLADNQARFGAIDGDVGLLANGRSAWITPHEGMPIEPGDQIRTSEDGRAEVSLSERMFILLEPKTHMSAERADSNSGRVNLLQGVLLGKLDSMGAAQRQNWEFNTPAAVCSVRGTEFALMTSPTEGTRLSVMEGEIDVQEAEGSQGLPPAVRIASSQEAWIARGKPLKELTHFSESMMPSVKRRSVLRGRQQRLKRIWTPFTPAIRKEYRERYMKNVPKERPARKTLKKRRLNTNPEAPY